MTVYTPAMLGPFLEQCAPSNLTASAKTQAGQLAADAIALSAKVQALEAELAKLQLQRVNETVNQPSGKKPEWDKGNDADPDKPPRKRKLNSFATSLADWSALYRAMISATNGNFSVGFGVLLMCCAKAPHCLSHKSRLVLPITAVGFASIKVCARLNG